MEELRTIRRGGPISGPDWLAQALDALTRSGLATQTRRGYQYDIAQFRRWLEKTGGSLPTLTKTDLETYKHHLKNVLRRRPSTTNHQMHALRWLCHWAHRRGILADDPASGAEPEKVPVRRRPAGLAEVSTNPVAAQLVAG